MINLEQKSLKADKKQILKNIFDYRQPLFYYICLLR